MNNDKIENNPSFQKMRKELEGFAALGDFLTNIGLGEVFEKRFKKNDFLKIKNDFDLLTKSPDKFNSHFAKLGWVAHETMNQDLMVSSIELAEQGHIEHAENHLVDYYSSSQMQWLTTTTLGVRELNERNDLINLAYEDTIAQRYHACIPVLLMIIDGAVNDIDKNKGFFAQGTSLTAWDSIAAHSSGLQVLKEIFNETRKKTSAEVITLPYRNGILHGRDLGYANQTVAAKCWAALFTIKDWAVTIRDGKRNAPPVEPEISIEESIEQFNETIKNFSQQHERNEQISKMVEEWKPRNLTIGIDLPSNGTSADYTDFTPEKEAIKFIELWKMKNYGNIARQIYNFGKSETNIGEEARKIRLVLDATKLNEYEIVRVVDCAPAISEVTLLVNFFYNNSPFSKEITLRFIYQGQNRESMVLGEKGGEWKFIDNLSSQLEIN